jgi:hypothetical protein
MTVARQGSIGEVRLDSHYRAQSAVPTTGLLCLLENARRSLAGAILGFAEDNQVIFDVSIDDEGTKAENLEHAKTLSHEMAQALGATHASSVLKYVLMAKRVINALIGHAKFGQNPRVR